MKNSMSVNWGSSGPNLGSSASSLGEALMKAVTGPSQASQDRAAYNQARMEALQHHNAVYDAQAEQYRQKSEADRIANEESVRQQGITRDAGRAAGEAAATRLPHPPLVLSPSEPAIVQYNADTDKVRKDAEFVYSGGGNMEQRAKGLGLYDGGNMIRSGSQDDYFRGNALAGRPLNARDAIPGVSGAAPVPINPDGSAASGRGASGKPMFNKDKTMVLQPDASDPSGYKYVPVGGTIQGNKNQEGVDAVNRALLSYHNLAQHNGVGPVVGSEWGRKTGHFFSTENAKIREEYEAARNKLILMERQRLMKGQGAVSDKDAAQIERMFPTFDAADPQVGIRTLLEMKKRLDGGADHLYDPATGGVSTGGATPETPAIQPGQVMDGHRYLGGNPADPTSWEAL